MQQLLVSPPPGMGVLGSPLARHDAAAPPFPSPRSPSSPSSSSWSSSHYASILAGQTPPPSSANLSPSRARAQELSSVRAVRAEYEERLAQAVAKAANLAQQLRTEKGNSGHSHSHSLSPLPLSPSKSSVAAGGADGGFAAVQMALAETRLKVQKPQQARPAPPQRACLG